VLAALEEFYAAPVEDIAIKLTKTLNKAASREQGLNRTLNDLRCDEFLGLYLEQVQSVPLETWMESMEEQDGTVRASIVGRELATIPGARRRALIIDDDHLAGGYLPLDGLPPERVKAALCYAHSVLAEDPFDEDQVIADFMAEVVDSLPHVSVRVAPDPEHFVSSVQALAALAPAVRAGHIGFAPRRLAMDARLAGKFAGSAFSAVGAQREELAQRSLRLWLASGGLVTPLFGDDDEEDAFIQEVGLLRPLTESEEAVKVSRVANLALPAAGRLDAHQMVAIREADEFEAFRVAQRHALASIGDDDSDAALTAYRAEMAAAGRALTSSVSNATSLRSLLTRTVGWGVGAMTLAPDGWRAVVAALGGITTQVVAERVVSRNGAGQRALRHHYATLSVQD
jgi:hypothetical protein